MNSIMLDENCEINKTCLTTLKYDDPKTQTKLILEYFKIEYYYLDELFKYKSIFESKNIFTIKDIYKIKDFFINNIQLNKLNMKYRYCKNLDGRFEGFEVNIKEDISKLEYFIKLINDLDNLDDNPNSFSDLNNNFFNTLSFLIDKSVYEKDDLYFSMYIKRDMPDIIEYLTKVYLYLVKSYEYKINLWINAFSIQKAYRLCHNREDILFFSHRINGWATPICQLNMGLSVEYKTNFGYGSSSYFYLKLKFKNIELIPFSQLIEYRNVGWFEIVQYTKTYNLSNKEWEPALLYLIEAYKILVKDEENFIQIYMIDEIKKLLKGLSDLMENEHYIFKDDHMDKITGEIINKDIKPIEVTILRAKKITNSLDFISKIQEYEHISEIGTSIIEIENFNKNMMYILDNELKLVNSQLEDINQQIGNLRPRYFNFKKKYDNFKNKEKLILKNNDYLDKKSHDIFLRENPNFSTFINEYEPVEKKFKELTNLQNSTKYIVKELNKYNESIIKYFKNK